ncbi:hypothetical protein CCMA1212_001243 [Trichoderma ghanense]|uniref:Uncharacterized protein n=1 Tax=Trichoderma ghanense TaxID=65468 RepID=A0ABY2HHL4_9HYPO
MSNQPAEDVPQGWSMVFANEDTMEVDVQPLLASAGEALADLLEMAWKLEMRAALRKAELWKRRSTAEVGRRLATDLAGLKK